MHWERPDRSIIALVSAPSGFAGRTDPIPVDTEDWNHVEPVNAVLRDLLGVPTSVLRLVSVEGGKVPFGGVVTYHVEAHGEPDRTRLKPATEPEPDAEPAARPEHKRHKKKKKPRGESGPRAVWKKAR